MPLFTRLSIQGRLERLFTRTERAGGLEKFPVERLDLAFAGIAGDCHMGLTRASDSRTLPLYARNTPIRNVRQISVVSVEDLAVIAANMGLEQVNPEWLGANMLLSGIPDLSRMPSSARLQFPSGATIAVDMENLPCRHVDDVIRIRAPELTKGFVAAAANRRGITAWVEREGPVQTGDIVQVWLGPRHDWHYT